ncbi:MAG: IMP dehydrogenase [Defluviitaleaceae bacterium]|nr:IMP dehydrogenase [Defluviitaleaceae bacterium]
MEKTGKIIMEGLRYNDVSLIPMYSNVKVRDICLKVKLTDEINLNAPIISSPMDTVTEARMAIAIARQGGIGIVHSNMTIEEQKTEVDKVKRSEFGIIKNPISLSPNHYVSDALNLMASYRISGIPITEYDKLVGIVTNRDLRFENNSHKKIYEVMTRENLITASEGVSMEEARDILTKHKIEKLPIVDEHGDLKGLITTKDISKSIQYPNSAKDKDGRLYVAAAVKIEEDMIERIEALVESHVDIIAIDTPHGHTELAIQAIRNIKEKFPDLPIISGNICTAKAAEDLIKAGTDILRVGVGPGSMSMTYAISGVSMPQVTAILQCAEVAKKYNVAVIGDGGVKQNGDIAKAIASGASAVVLGSALAGCDECPGGVELFQGVKYKKYRSSPHRVLGSELIKTESAIEMLEGRIAFKGAVQFVVAELLKGLKSSMVYCGTEDIENLRENGKFVKVVGNQ